MISSKLIAHSIDATTDKPIYTFELEYPRFIHAEFMTHRLFSRNAASSRAIPIKKQLQLIEDAPAMPEVWGLDQSGMQAEKTLIKKYEIATAEFLWGCAKTAAVNAARALAKFKLHKQIVNRVVEPFAHIKVVMSTTEIENFLWLRDHPDAQPEIKILAGLMKADIEKSEPTKLLPGQWHVPYYHDGFWIEYLDGVDKHGNTLEDALAISSSCCAQVSYRVLNDTLEKAKDIFSKLVLSKPVHASPFEHQATPISNVVGKNYLAIPSSWEKGITHLHKEMGFGSGNFYGWIQHRQLIDEHCKW